jgi:stress-induced-phosphoprotein 1
MTTAEEYKDAGNKAFSAKDFDEAIKCYTKAIAADKTNHLYFSNRSASYASKKEWELAITDAKECIKLDPTFIKGYYRLATAQIEAKHLDAAATTIKQGLNIDPDNAQLMKLSKNIKALKNAEKMKTSKAPNAASMAGVSGDSVVSKELNDLRDQYRQTIRDYNVCNASIASSEKILKMNQITMRELEQIPSKESERKMYRGIGKMFMLQTKDQIFDYLEQEINENAKKSKDLMLKKEYLEKRMTSQQQNITELVQGAH